MPRRVDQLDKIIAGNIRFYRLRAGLSQKVLGTLIGVSFQQIQKCETGINRMPASRLYVLALALGVPLYRMFLPPQASDISVRAMLGWLRSRRHGKLQANSLMQSRRMDQA